MVYAISSGYTIIFLDTETTEVTELSFITFNRFTNLDAIEVYLQPCSSRVNFKHALWSPCLLSCPLNVA